MKKLEKNILEKIYKIETKRTASYFISRFIILITLGFVSLIFTTVIIEILKEQSSFDLFDFLKDDWEMVRNYFFNNLLLFIQELPLPLVFILTGLLLILILLIYLSVRNFNKIKNKSVSIYKFWLKKL